MLEILLFSVLIICFITDITRRKIYNKVLFPGVVMAFLLNGILFGWSGITTSLLGLLTGFLILLIPYLIGGMGAGDVKLLAFIGAVQGAGFVLMTALFMALIGGVVGLVLILMRGRMIEGLKRSFRAVKLMKYGIKPELDHDKLLKRTAFPYGVAIALGAAGAFFYPGVML